MYQKVQSINKLIDSGAVIFKTELSKCTHKQDPESQPDPEPAHFPETFLTLGSEPEPNQFLTLGSEVDSEPPKIQAAPDGAAGACTFCREPELDPEPFQHFARSRSWSRLKSRRLLTPAAAHKTCAE